MLTGKLAESEGLVVSLRAQLAVAETSKVHAETVAKVTAERDMFQSPALSLPLTEVLPTIYGACAVARAVPGGEQHSMESIV